MLAIHELLLQYGSETVLCLIADKGTVYKKRFGCKIVSNGPSSSSR